MDDEKLEQEIVNSALLALIRGGDINPKGKVRAGLLRAAMRRLQKGSINWKMVVDHQQPLLSRAQSAVADGDEELGVSLYATVVEHALNFIISYKSTKLGLSESQLEALFKDTQIRAKFIWSHLLLGRRVPKKEYDQLCLVNSIRNEFVHYKWKETDKKHDARVKGAVRASEVCVKYLKSVIEKHVDRGFKGFDDRQT